MYDGIFLTIGWQLKIIILWFPALCVFVWVENFGVPGCCTFAMFSVIRDTHRENVWLQSVQFYTFNCLVLKSTDV